MDFSEIQPVSLNSHLGQPISINNAADLSLCFNSMANVGDRVEMFFSIAENNPEVAIRSFITVIRNSTSAPIRALAIQSLGKVPQPYKQALASCESQESQDLLKLLCTEIQSRTNDLTAWAAIEALKEIGFSTYHIEHPDGGNLSEPLRRIQNEILDRQIAQIAKIEQANTRGQPTAEYERVLEFWAYGPISELFNENLGHFNYLNLVRDVLHLTQLRGVQLGLSADNLTVRQESFAKVKEVFQSYRDSQDRNFKQNLGDTLKIRFLKDEKSEESDLQKLTEAILFDKPTQINLQSSDLAKMAISDMEDRIALLKERCYDISAIFASGIDVSIDPSLNSFLIAHQDNYLQEPKAWIERLEQQLELIENERGKIPDNINLLNQVLDDIHGLSFVVYIFNKFSPIIIKFTNLEFMPNNYQELQVFLSSLTKLKNNFIGEIGQRRNQINEQINEANQELNTQEKWSGWRWVTAGITVAFVLMIPVASKVVTILDSFGWIARYSFLLIWNYCLFSTIYKTTSKTKGVREYVPKSNKTG